MSLDMGWSHLVDSAAAIGCFVSDLGDGRYWTTVAGFDIGPIEIESNFATVFGVLRLRDAAIRAAGPPEPPAQTIL